MVASGEYEIRGRRFVRRATIAPPRKHRRPAKLQAPAASRLERFRFHLLTLPASFKVAFS